MTTLTEARTAIDDNAGYRSANSLAMCNAFIDACERWLLLFAFDESENGQGGSRVRMDRLNGIIESRLNKAISWRDNQATASSVTAQSAGYSKADLSGGRE